MSDPGKGARGLASKPSAQIRPFLYGVRFLKGLMEKRRSHPLAPISKASAKRGKPRDGQLREGRKSWCSESQCLGAASYGVRTLH